MKGKIKAISVSSRRGEKKKNVSRAMLRKNYGICGDAHAGKWKRQVSLLQYESILKMIKKGADVKPGDFAENITTEDFNLTALRKGDFLRIGEKVVLKITQKGKKCHHGCSVFELVGDCVMPREGVFAEVIKGGKIKKGDSIGLWKKRQLS
ncbi:MAG: MOSC domain-containing protein [Elusimicrobia bacterium]|nr:MOSC domain-containing protein [Elusimicrobiota bacterium]